MKEWFDLIREEFDVDINEDVVYAIDQPENVLEEDWGYLLGFISYSILNEKYFSILSMYVKKEYRSLSKFKVLLDFAERRAREEDCKYVCAGQELAYNEKVFYNALNKLGFNKITLVRKEL